MCIRRPGIAFAEVLVAADVVAVAVVAATVADAVGVVSTVALDGDSFAHATIPIATR